MSDSQVSLLTPKHPLDSANETIFLTPRDIAQRLKLSLTAVYALCDSGAIPCHRVGVKRGRRRIREQDFVAYLERTRIGPPVTFPSRNGSVPPRGAPDGFKLLRAAGWKGELH